MYVAERSFEGAHRAFQPNRGGKKSQSGRGQRGRWKESIWRGALLIFRWCTITIRQPGLREGDGGLRQGEKK